MDKRAFFLNEISAWAREGLIDDTTRTALEARYAADANTSAGWRSVILPSIGALLVGLGIIALLGANWDALSRPARAAVSVTPLTVCAALWVAGELRCWRSRGFLEPLGVFWSLAIGVGISLIAQTYQISGSPASFALTWTLLILPVLYATRALGAGVGYFAGLFTWVCIRAATGENSQLYWLFAAAAFPAFAMIRAEAPHGARLRTLVWIAALLSTAALGFTLEKVTPGLWMIIYSGAFAALFSAGLLREPRGASIWQTPMRTLGAAGLSVVTYLLAFRWPWQEIGWYNNRWDRVESWAQALFDYTLAAALPLLAMLLLALVWRRLTTAGQRGWTRACIVLWGAAPIVLALLYAVYAQILQHDIPGLSDGTPALACTTYVAALGIATLGTGLERRALTPLNCGVLLLLALICGKFFSDEYSFTARGIVFLVCGALFFVTNSVAAKKLKRGGKQA